MVRTRLNIGCRYSTPVRERPLHPTRGHFTPEPSQTQAPVTPATEPERRAGGSLTTLLDISKRGSQLLRTLLVYGARPVVRTVVRRKAAILDRLAEPAALADMLCAECDAKPETGRSQSASVHYKPGWRGSVDFECRPRAEIYAKECRQTSCDRLHMRVIVANAYKMLRWLYAGGRHLTPVRIQRISFHAILPNRSPPALRCPIKQLSRTF